MNGIDYLGVIVIVIVACTIFLYMDPNEISVHQLEDDVQRRHGIL